MKEEREGLKKREEREGAWPGGVGGVVREGVVYTFYLYYYFLPPY